MEERVAELERCIRGAASAEELCDSDIAQRTVQLTQKVTALEAGLGTPYQQFRRRMMQVQPLLRAYGAEGSDGDGRVHQDGLSQEAKQEVLLDAQERMYASMAALEDTVALGASALGSEHLADLPALERSAAALEGLVHESASGAVACHEHCDALLNAFDAVVGAVSEKFVRYDAMLRAWENKHGIASA